MRSQLVYRGRGFDSQPELKFLGLKPSPNNFLDRIIPHIHYVALSRVTTIEGLYIKPVTSLLVEAGQLKFSESNFLYDLLLLRLYIDLKVIHKLKFLSTLILAG